jgi:hypothetical protein
VQVISSSQSTLPTQHITNRRGKSACRQRDSNPRPQKSRGCRTARPRRSAHSLILFSHNPANVHSAGAWTKFDRTLNISYTVFPNICCRFASSVIMLLTSALCCQSNAEQTPLQAALSIIWPLQPSLDIRPEVTR